MVGIAAEAAQRRGRIKKRALEARRRQSRETLRRTRAALDALDPSGSGVVSTASVPEFTRRVFPKAPVGAADELLALARRKAAPASALATLVDSAHRPSAGLLVEGAARNPRDGHDERQAAGGTAREDRASEDLPVASRATGDDDDALPRAALAYATVKLAGRGGRAEILPVAS